MIKNLPYTSLRAFEAVVRLRGFGRAAEELNVTQSSISQHIKLLEDWTSRSLLIRGKKETLPTKDGHLLADAVADGLGAISRACEALQSKEDKDTALVVSAPSGFAVNWLFPRLLRFDELHPNIPISISTVTNGMDFDAAHHDVAIHYGKEMLTGVYCEEMLSENIFPVCSPKLLSRKPQLKKISDLRNHTLLLDEPLLSANNYSTWEGWAKGANDVLPRPKNTRQFGQANMVIQAAIEGLGIALGRESLVIDALNEGRLVRPFKSIAKSEFSYWFVCLKKSIKRKSIKAFRDWLFEEAKKQPRIKP